MKLGIHVGVQALVQKPSAIDLPKSLNVAASYPLTTFILGQFSLKEAHAVSSLLLVSIHQKGLLESSLILGFKFLLK